MKFPAVESVADDESPVVDWDRLPRTEDVLLKAERADESAVGRELLDLSRVGARDEDIPIGGGVQSLWLPFDLPPGEDLAVGLQSVDVAHGVTDVEAVVLGTGDDVCWLPEALEA